MSGSERRPNQTARQRRRELRRTSRANTTAQPKLSIKSLLSLSLSFILAAMTRLERNVNIVAVLLPFVGFVAAAVLLWNRFLGPPIWCSSSRCTCSSRLGVTVGFHRLLTHRAFQTYPWMRYLFAILGSLSRAGPGDRLGRRPPQAPHLHRRGGRPAQPARRSRRRAARDAARPVARPRRLAVRDARPGLLAALRPRPRHRPDDAPHQPRLPADRPRAACCCRSRSGSRSAAARSTPGSSALLWAGLVRIFLVHHVTWSINSICHFFGARRFDTDDQSTNVFWLALPSLGEAWHHNHHAFPQSAFHGLRWYELDPSGWLILAMARARPRLGRRQGHPTARQHAAREARDAPSA